MKTNARSNLFSIVIMVMMLVFLVACGEKTTATSEAPAEVEPTKPPPPTNTTAPTDIPLPSNTPEPTATMTPVPTDTTVPTETPDTAATQTAEAAVAVEALTASISKELTDLEIAPDKGKLSWVQQDPLIVKLGVGEGRSSSPFAEEMTFKNFIMGADITWKLGGGTSMCGIMFHAEPNLQKGDYYIYTAWFWYDTPWWGLQYFKDGMWVLNIGDNLYRNYTVNDEDGAVNHYIIMFEKGLITAYANGERLGRGTSSSIPDGIMGLQAYQQSGESTTCTMENAWIWSLDE